MKSIAIARRAVFNFRSASRRVEVADIVKLVEAEEAKIIPEMRDPYKPRKGRGCLIAI